MATINPEKSKGPQNPGGFRHGRLNTYNAWEPGNAKTVPATGKETATPVQVRKK